jgi:hypothetical protein
MKKFGILIFCLVSGTAFAQPMVSLEATTRATSQGTEVTLTWVSENADVCNASEGWTGTKATEGSEVLFITANTRFNLNCTKNSANVAVKWLPPTQRTDETSLTNLTEHEVYYSASQNPGIAAPVIVAMPVSEYVFENIPLGTWFFGVKAKDANGLVSEMSTIGSKTVVATSANSIALAEHILQPPKPPTLVTIETIAYEIRDHHVHGYVVWRPAGSVELGVECNLNFNLGGYYEVPLEKVRLNRQIRYMVVVARCA